MAFTTNNLYEAIGRAAMMADRVGGRYVVTAFRGRWRVIQRGGHINPDDIVWRSWKQGRGLSMPVANTQANRDLARSLPRAEAADAMGVNPWQYDYAVKKYGWETKPWGVEIDVEELRNAMTRMSAGAFAKKKGVYPSRIYAMCREYNIPRPIRDRRGRVRRSGDQPGILVGRPARVTPDMLREDMQTMTAKQAAEKHGMDVSWIYAMCKKFNIPRPVRNRIGAPQRKHNG